MRTLDRCLEIALPAIAVGQGEHCAGCFSLQGCPLVGLPFLKGRAVGHVETCHEVAMNKGYCLLQFCERLRRR